MSAVLLNLAKAALKTGNTALAKWVYGRAHGQAKAIAGAALGVAFAYTIASDADVATVNAATLVGSERIGVAKGSTITAQTTLAATGLQVSAYGTGVSPLFDASAALGAWVASAAETDIWEQTVDLPNNVKAKGNVGYSSIILPQVATIAALRSAAADTVFMTGWTGATSKLQIKVSPGGNPNTDGRSYWYTKRLYGLQITGDNARVSGLTLRRNAHQDGSLIIGGENAMVSNVRVEDGCRHAMYLGAGAQVSNCYFYRARNDLEGSANLLVINQASVLGKPAYTSTGNTYDAGDQSACTGIDAHGSVAADLFTTSSSTNDTFINVLQGLISAAAACTVTNPVCTNVAQLVSVSPTGSNCTVTGATGTCNKMASGGAAGVTFTSRNNTLTVPALGTAFYHFDDATAANTITIDGDNITVTAEAVVANPSELIRVARGSLTVKNCTFGPALAPPIDTLIRAGFSSQTVTFVSQNNVYPRGSIWIINGTTYRSIAELQAAGLDTGSVYAAMPAATFSDDFNRADGNLDGSTGWTRTGGAANQAGIRSNNLSMIGTTQTLYSVPALASANHYVRGTVRSVPASAGPFPLAARSLDASNWMGARWSSTNYTVGRCVAGTISAAIGSFTTTPAAGDDVILAIRGTVFTLIVNDKALIVNSQIGDSGALGANVLAGTLPRSSTLDPAFDNFSCGVI